MTGTLITTEGYLLDWFIKLWFNGLKESLKKLDEFFLLKGGQN